MGNPSRSTLLLARLLLDALVLVKDVGREAFLIYAGIESLWMLALRGGHTEERALGDLADALARQLRIVGPKPDALLRPDWAAHYERLVWAFGAWGWFARGLHEEARHMWPELPAVLAAAERDGEALIEAACDAFVSREAFTGSAKATKGGA